jgi:hypothetical protein
MCTDRFIFDNKHINREPPGIAPEPSPSDRFIF